MTRVAAVDCGTNTIRLLVADLDPAGGSEVVLSRLTSIVRLGEGVDRTGRLSPGALDRVLTAVEEYAAVATEHGAQARRFVATSAARDADNADELTRGVQERFGVRPEVVSGDEEARLTFTGARRALPHVPTPLAVLDIGGGSTEVVLGGDAVQAARSLDLGSVRLTERLMPSDPPTRAELQAAGDVVEAGLDSLPAAGMRLADARTLAGVAGTVTSIGTLLLGLASWDRDRVHRSSFPVDHARSMAARLTASTIAEREALGIPPGRSDVIGAGALILDRVLARTSVSDLVVCDADILDGVAWSIA